MLKFDTTCWSRASHLKDRITLVISILLGECGLCDFLRPIESWWCQLILDPVHLLEANYIVTSNINACELRTEIGYIVATPCFRQILSKIDLTDVILRIRKKIFKMVWDKKGGWCSNAACHLVSYPHPINAKCCKLYKCTDLPSNSLTTTVAWAPKVL